MRIAAQKVNNTGIQISKNKMVDAVKYYTITYNQMCERLYDLGYISSSATFFEDEFWDVFFEEHTDLISWFRNNRTGAMNMSTIQLKYVLLNLDSDSDEYLVLSTVDKLLDAKQALDDFAKFNAAIKFPKKNNLLQCKTSLSVSNRVSNAGKLPLDSPYIMACFHIPEGKHVIELDYTIKLFESLIEKLGIACDLDESAQSIFLGDKFTIKDDCTFLYPLIRGEIEGTGKHAKLLHSVVEKYYVDYYSTRTTIAECIGYTEKNFLDAIPSCIEYINEFRNKLGTYQEFFVTSNKVYFLVDSEEVKQEETKSEYYIGSSLYDYFSGKPLGVMNRLLGYSGQYVYEYDTKAINYSLRGIPVQMYQISSNRGSLVPIPLLYYPIITIKQKYQNELVDVYPSTKCKKEDYKNLDEVLKFLEVDSIDSLVTDVADVVTTYYGEHTSSFRKLVGVLIQALICVMCDYTLEGRKAPNHIILGDEFSWVTDKNYLDACVEAEILFNKLGF